MVAWGALAVLSDCYVSWVEASPKCHSLQKITADPGPLAASTLSGLSCRSSGTQPPRSPYCGSCRCRRLFSKPCRCRRCSPWVRSKRPSSRRGSANGVLRGREPRRTVVRAYENGCAVRPGCAPARPCRPVREKGTLRDVWWHLE